MKKILTGGIIFALVFAVFASVGGVTPALAKVTNTVPGGNIQYFSSGHVDITVPTSTTGFPLSSLSFRLTHFEDSTYGSYDQMTVYMISPAGSLVPLCVVTTGSQAAADFARLAWKNTPVYIPNTPANNVIQLSSDELKVDRHGNSIAADFNPSTPSAKITLHFPNAPVNPTGFLTLYLPAFHVELNKYGGSVHSAATSTALLPYSGYTLEADLIGFDANYEFSCTAWNLNNAAGTDGFIAMHGIQIWTPP
jgi:hypothetical protein